MGNNSVRVALRPQEFLVMAIKHVPSMCQNFTSLPRRFPLLRPSPPLSRRNPSTCLGRHRIACSYARRMSMSRRLKADTYTVRRAQRTHGTTDPGGVWHPVHRRECLTILLGTYAENGQSNRPMTIALYSVHQPACDCASASPWFLPIGVCSPMQSTTPVQVR